MTEARQYQIIGLLWLILASTGSMENWLAVIATNIAFLMAVAYIAAAIWTALRGSKEGRDG